MNLGLILVEGPTEEQFVNQCLGPYLLAKDLIGNGDRQRRAAAAIGIGIGGRRR